MLQFCEKTRLNGVPLMVVAKNLGHTDTRMVMLVSCYSFVKSPAQRRHIASMFEAIAGTVRVHGFVSVI